MRALHWLPRVQEALAVVNEVMLSRGISLPLDSQRRIGEEDRFVKGREIQFPIYGDRIKQAVNNLPEEQKREYSKIPYSTLLWRPLHSCKTRFTRRGKCSLRFGKGSDIYR